MSSGRRARATRAPDASPVRIDALPEVAANTPDPPVVALQAEQRRRVRAAVERLPEHERTIVALRYLGDLSYPEIAAFLGIRDATARKRAHVLGRAGRA